MKPLFFNPLHRVILTSPWYYSYCILWLQAHIADLETELEMVGKVSKLHTCVALYLARVWPVGDYLYFPLAHTPFFESEITH